MMTSKLCRGIEAFTSRPVMFGRGSAQAGDLVVNRKGGTVSKVVQVMSNGALLVERYTGTMSILTRPEELRICKDWER